MSQQTQLKSSHQKKLLQSLKKQYPFVDDETWKIIFPSKSSVLMSKLSNKIILYSIKLKGVKGTDKIPIYFFQMRINAQDCVYPTLYLLWNLPNFLPCICIQSPVSQFILRGADLMLPGVSRDAHHYYQHNRQLNTVHAKDLNTIRVNEILAIKIIGNPLPVGIGYSILSSKQITVVGAKGRFLRMMHVFRDQLWEFGGKRKPNQGFLSNIIKPIEIQTINDNQNKNKHTHNEQKEEAKEADPFDIKIMKFNALSIDDKLIYGFFSTLLSVSCSCLPVIVRDIYQQMRQDNKMKQFKDIDVKQTSFNKLARFVQSKQFETFITCKQQKSKTFIHAMNAKLITKHLLLLLNKIEHQQFDCIIKWFQDNNEKEQWIQDKKTFEAWYDIQYKSDTNDAKSIIDNLFGGWSNILQCADINQAFFNHLSQTFNIILCDGDGDGDSPEFKKLDRKNPDQVFRVQFLQTLKESVHPTDLPVSASTILTKQKLYILQPNFVFSKRNLLKVNLDSDIITSAKQTHWKKSAKFLKDLNKENIIQLKDYGNIGGELMITSINYHYLSNSFNKNGEYLFFTPQAFEKFCRKIKQLTAKELDSERKENDCGNIAEETHFTASDKKDKKVSIQTMYRANHRLLPIFGEDNISKLHSKNKARTYLWSYVRYHQLMGRNKSNIAISQQLFHMLYDSKMFHNRISKDGFRNKKEKEKLKAVQVNSMVHRKDLVNLFDEYMQPYTAVILDDDEPPKFKPGYPPKIEITADKRQGTKYMTHVIGLEDYGIDCNEFAVTAKKYFAAAVTVSSLHGKKSKMKGGGTKQKVSIQGNMVKDVSKQDVPTLLITNYGIPERFINAKTNITKQAKK